MKIISSIFLFISYFVGYSQTISDSFFKLIDTTTVEITVFKFMQLEKKGNGYRNSIYLSPKTFAGTDINNLCSNFVHVIPKRTVGYNTLIWHILRQDSINKVREFLIKPLFIREKLEFGNYTLEEYRFFTGQEKIYELSKQIVFSAIKIRARVAFVYFSYTPDLLFPRYTLWDDLLGDGCLFNNVTIFPLQIIDTGTVDEKHIKLLFNKSKPFNRTISHIPEG